ncbi:MAG: polysaccharide deacetylase family protein [Ktedonobacteraceae bacterium]
MFKRLETFVAACFYYSGLVQLVRWWKQLSDSGLVILNYHRADGGDLRRHLLYLRRHYRILHLEAALEELYTPYKRKQQKRDRRVPLVLTFDDGYYDNYTYGFTLAQELHLPITIFLIPGYIDNGHRFWWEEGSYLASQTQVDTATIEGYTYHLHKAEQREALAHTIDAHVRHATSVSEREQFLASMHEILQVPLEASAEEKAALPITWQEAQEMQASGWVSFGAHTMHHPILAYLADPAEAQREVKECHVILEQQLGHPVRTFAYPVGRPEHIGAYGLQATQEAGYAWAVTTMYGFNTPYTNPYLLRRLDVDVDQHWLTIAAKTSGVWGFFSHLLWMPITFMRKHLRKNAP